MKEAYKYQVEFGRNGRCVKRTIEIGATVPCAVIAIAFAVAGKDISPSVLSLIQAILK